MNRSARGPLEGVRILGSRTIALMASDHVLGAGISRGSSWIPGNERGRFPLSPPPARRVGTGGNVLPIPFELLLRALRVSVVDRVAP